MARIHRTIQKDLHDPDNHNGVITFLETDILESEVKWALGSITMNKASRGDGTALSNTKRWCCESVALNMPANLENSAVTQDWKRSVSMPIPKKGNAKECSSYETIALISHASKVMLKILQARLQQYMNSKLPDVQAGFQKGRGTRDQIANICWIIEKAREFQKNICFCFYWLCQSFWLYGLQQTVEHSSRDETARPPDLPPEKSVCSSKSDR